LCPSFFNFLFLPISAIAQFTMLLTSPALLFLLPAFASAHSNHHTHHVIEEPFSPERLEELERKWGTDVNFLLIRGGRFNIDCDSGGFLEYQHSHIFPISDA
jgi:hypothetical protein